MTNTEIIRNAAKAAGLTDAQLLQLSQLSGDPLPFHTFAAWKAQGYHVKKGEKALFSAPLWKWTSKPAQGAADLDPDAPPCETGHYYRKLSYLFGPHQVERDAAAQ